MADMTTEAAGAGSAGRYSLWELVRYMLALGTWGFGGPVALAGYMYRDLVERRGWISDSDYNGKDKLLWAIFLSPSCGVSRSCPNP